MSRRAAFCTGVPGRLKGRRGKWGGGVIGNPGEDTKKKRRRITGSRPEEQTDREECQRAHVHVHVRVRTDFRERGRVDRDQHERYEEKWNKEKEHKTQT